MNRLVTYIKQKREQQEKLFCAYVTLGYPSLAFSEELIPLIEEAGVDILELGIPFSDPLADGPTIQEASHVSLQHNTRVPDAFALLTRLRKKGVELPIVFFSYYNPIFRLGRSAFVRALGESGFDGVICPDLPPDEDQELERELQSHQQSLIYLIAPTTSLSRLKLIARRSHGFIYYVSRRGVTGMQHTLERDLIKNVRTIKKYTTTSVLVGFGISDREQIQRILTVSDGVIVGSAIINHIKKTNSATETATFVRELVTAVKQTS